MDLLSETISDGSVSFNYKTFEQRNNRPAIIIENSGTKNEYLPLLGQHSGRRILNRFEKVVLMATCLFLYMTGFGLFSALGVVYVTLPDALHCDKSEAALVQSMFIGFSLAGSIVTSKIVLRWDVGVCVMVASLTGTAGLCCCMLVSNVAAVIVMVGMIGGLSVSVILIASSVTVNWTFIDNRKFALSLTSLGSSLGMITMPYIASALLDAYTWDGCLLVLGVALLANCFPCGLVVYFARDTFVRYTDTHMKKSFWTLGTFKDAALIMYLITTFIYNLFGIVGQMFVVDLAVVRGLTIDQGTIVLSTFGLIGLFGRLGGVASLYIRPDIHASIVFIVSALVSAVTFYVLGATGDFGVMCVASGVQGFCTSVVIAFLPSFMITLKDVDSFPYMLAITNLMSGVGQAIAGYVGGLTYDLTESYTVIFDLSAIVFVVSSCNICAIHFIQRRRGQLNYTDAKIIG